MNESKQFYIKIDGEPIAVTEDVYRAYKRPFWAERKRNQIRAEHELALDLMDDSVADSQTSAEEAIINKISLAEALAALSVEDNALIEALFFEGITERDYAGKIGISQKNVNKKKQRILSDLKKYFTQ